MEFFPLLELAPIYAISAAFARIFSILSEVLVFFKYKIYVFLKF